MHDRPASDHHACRDNAPCQQVLRAICCEFFSNPLARLMMQMPLFGGGLSVQPGVRSYAHEFMDSKGCVQLPPTRPLGGHRTIVRATVSTPP